MELFILTYLLIFIYLTTDMEFFTWLDIKTNFTERRRGWFT